MRRRPERVFYFRLALALGMTVAEMLSRISARELMEWMAYYRLEPFGQERENLHAAMVAAAVVNVNRGERQRPVKPADFMLRMAAADEPITAMAAPDSVDLWRKFKDWARGNSGNVGR